MSLNSRPESNKEEEDLSGAEAALFHEAIGFVFPEQFLQLLSQRLGRPWEGRYIYIYIDIYIYLHI